MTSEEGAPHREGGPDEFFANLLARSAALRLPELFSSSRPHAIYQVCDRHGVSVVCLETRYLSSTELTQIMTYRLAQYVALGYVNARMVFEARLEHEPLHYVGPDDLHVVAGSAEDGEILCYMVLKAAPQASPGITLRSRERELFPVEKVFGWGIYNRLRLLPDFPIDRLRELERFVRNQQRQELDELAARAPVELTVAILRTLLGPLASEVDACLADVEQGVKAKKMWDYFHVPGPIIHGVIPYMAPDDYPLPSYERQTRYPTAFLCSDISRERLDRIEEALARPGKQGVAALFSLKADPCVRRSSLEPTEGLAPLTDAEIRQQGVAMEVRRLRLDLGEWLRQTAIFRTLSTAEAAVLGTLLERRSASAGDFVVRAGEAGDDLYLIESGRAEVQIVDSAGKRIVVRHLQAGDYFGEIALLTDGTRTADVIATEPMVLLRLEKDAYTRYLVQAADVERQIMRTALGRSQVKSAVRPRRHESGDALASRFAEALPSDGIVSDPAVIDERYRRNVTCLERRIPLVLRPASEDQVRGIVSVANANHIPLYPFSTGKNWGLGSKLPVVDGCVVVDLSRMNRIVEVNEPFAYAILEPGVTQGQLAAYLAEHHPSLTLNFTGSFAHTSIVGNVLERGDGSYARVHDLLGVRGVLGNGERFQVGGLWNHLGTDRPSHHSRYVAGPDLTGMFSQSSFGITTQMAFRLVPKPERCYVFWGIAPDESLAALVNAFDHLGRQGVINRGSVNIGYANRFVQGASAMTGDGGAAEGVGDWNFYALLPGTARLADAALEEVRAAVSPHCRSTAALRVEEGTDPRAELPPFLHPLVKPLLGSPDDESLRLIYQLTGTPVPANAAALDADQTPFGMKCYIPVVPPQGEHVRRAADIVARVRARFGVNMKPSFFGDGRALITLHFRSDEPEQVRRAEQCEAALWSAMVEAGFPPYRASIDQMQRLRELHPALYRLIGQLKSVLDPSGIISPGRYS